MITRKQGIIGFSVLLSGVVIYSIYNKSMKNKKIAIIEAAIKDPTTLSGTPADIASSPYLNPSYYKSKGATEMNGQLGVVTTTAPYWTGLLTRTTADIMAKNIHDAYHVFTPNNQAAMITEIQEAGSKVKLSYLASVFLQDFGMPLGDFLVAHMDVNNLAQVQKIINGLS